MFASSLYLGYNRMF